MITESRYNQITNATPENEPEDGQTVDPLRLALDGVRTSYDGFEHKDQFKLARLLDTHNALDHSAEVIRLDAAVKLTNRKASPQPNDDVVLRTKQEWDDIYDAERHLTKSEFEALEQREVQDWEVKKFNEIRERKATIRKATDQAHGHGYEEAKAYIEDMQKKHLTTHRPTTELEKEAARRHTNALDGTYSRKDRLTQVQADFAVAHGDDTSTHPDDQKNLRKQTRGLNKVSRTKESSEDEVWQSLWHEGPEQKRISWKRSRVAKKIADLSRELREKGLWIDDLFELNPTEPNTPNVSTPTPPTPYVGVKLPDIASTDTFSSPDRDTRSSESRTELALRGVLDRLVLDEEVEGPIDTAFITGVLSTIEGATPALAKFTLQKLERSGIIDKDGALLVNKAAITAFLSEQLEVSQSTRREETGTAKTKVANRLSEIQKADDRLYAFALEHIAGFYSDKTDGGPLPRLSVESFTSATKRALERKDAPIDPEIIKQVYERLIRQGILGVEGTVRTSREVITGEIGRLYGDADMVDDPNTSPLDIIARKPIKHADLAHVKSVRSGRKPSRKPQR
jgi:hypothetical protein